MTRCCIATLLLVVNASAQDATPPPEWSEDVARACLSRRYGLRLAAARKVGAAGDAAVSAVRAFQREHGRDAVAVTLVEAIAARGGDGAAVLQLREEWSLDRDFFWRSQALRGLALRADDATIAARYRQQFLEHVEDPAWLVRVYARLGYARANVHRQQPCDDPEFAPEQDPRARTRLAVLAQDPADVLPALADERTFLGDPWGRRRANEALQLLKKLTDGQTTYRLGAGYEDNRSAIEELVRLVGEQSRHPVPAVDRLVDPGVQFAGGIEVFSCRNGDLFLRWTADGRVFAGLESAAPVELAGDTWQELSSSATALDLPSQSGVVICDRMRIVPGPTLAQAAVAPNSLPVAATEWLKQLAAALEEAGNRELAVALRDRLVQFAIR